MMLSISGLQYAVLAFGVILLSTFLYNALRFISVFVFILELYPESYVWLPGCHLNFMKLGLSAYYCIQWS